MRLKSYLLTEDKALIDDYDNLVSIIKKNCSQYIKEVNSSNNGKMFVREVMSFDSDGLAYIQSLRKGREPKDSDKEGHKLFDDFLYKKFKIRGRSEGWFVWARKVYNIGLSFSFTRLIFPYNKYKYIWSPEVPDLILGNKKDVENFIEKHGKSYKTKDAFKLSGEQYYEVMLRAPKCVLVKTKNLDDRQKFIEDIGIKNIKVE